MMFNPDSDFPLLAFLNGGYYRVTTSEKSVSVVCIDKDGNRSTKALPGKELPYLLNENISGDGDVRCKVFNTFNSGVDKKTYDKHHFPNLFEYDKARASMLASTTTVANVPTNQYIYRFFDESPVDMYGEVDAPLRTMTWDIEVVSEDPTMFPNSAHKHDFISCICGTVHNSHRDKNPSIVYMICYWKHGKVNKQMMNELISRMQSKVGNPDIEHHIVFVDNEEDLIMEFAKSVDKFKPAILTGFNDFGFDWPYVKGRLERYYPDRLAEFTRLVLGYENTNMKFAFTKRKSKISAQYVDVEITYPMSKTFIPIDVCFQLRRIYENERYSSLAFYCGLIGIDGKDPITLDIMRSGFEGDWNACIDTLVYCMVDSWRCQQLLVAKSVVGDAIEMSKLCGLMLNDCLLRANSFKVQRCVETNGSKFGYVFDYGNRRSIESDTTYTGGFVMDLEDRYFTAGTPVFALDFASLYPNIMRTFNISHDVDIAGTLPVDTCEQVRKRFVDHKGDPEKMGLLVRLLDGLFEMRDNAKKAMKSATTSLERETFNQKQKAVKVVMNSIYGVAGSKSNVILGRRDVAKAITACGRELIQAAMSFATSKGFKVIYGDTDSCYISVPESTCVGLTFDERVQSSFIQAAELQTDINKFISDYTGGHSYLKMAFEEVLLPVYFMKKKVYTGIKHENEVADVDDHENNLFVRGCSFATRSATILEKSVVRDGLIKELFSKKTVDLLIDADQETTKRFIDESITRTLIKLALDFVNRKYDLANFVCSDKYSVNKKNIKVNNFVRRLEVLRKYLQDNNDSRLINYPIPGNAERFEYVYVTVDTNSTNMVANTMEAKMFVPPGRVKARRQNPSEVCGVDDIKCCSISYMMEYPCYISDFDHSRIAYPQYYESNVYRSIEPFFTDAESSKKNSIKSFEGLIRKAERIVENGEAIDDEHAIQLVIDEGDEVNRKPQIKQQPARKALTEADVAAIRSFINRTPLSQG